MEQAAEGLIGPPAGSSSQASRQAQGSVAECRLGAQPPLRQGSPRRPPPSASPPLQLITQYFDTLKDIGLSGKSSTVFM